MIVRLKILRMSIHRNKISNCLIFRDCMNRKISSYICTEHISGHRSFKSKKQKKLFQLYFKINYDNLIGIGNIDTVS